MGRIGDMKAGITKAFTKNETFEKTELLDVVYWIRQGVGVLLGVLLGLIGVTGMVGFIVFAFAGLYVPIMYYRGFLDIDEDDFGGSRGLIVEGFSASGAVFILSWTLLYSLVHG
eukprot:Plantae.Rhodophyta-Rhodochaete_pulchella.ctg182.p3 GENE.Plantae.Rhodophyta-Rhodochaete_pulchella.ctg182~~Plantae.Rhodophyta-Rhodochaete_pulchella.ctg182.p3  ORF type:complete len:114 (+),score=22.18 Plantae.Rhodophyta-Rhodochaete_pulchella.ctg182:497-838(+)